MRLTSSWQQCLLPLALLWLSGCSMLQTAPPAPSDWQHYKSQVQTLDNWTLYGKISFQSSNNKQQASFHWEQQNENFDIQLSGPFGAGKVRISGSPDLIVLRKPGEADQVFHDQEDLLNAGWEFPVEEIPFWVRGISAPMHKIEAWHFDAGRLSSLQQDGWLLEFPHYQTYAIDAQEWVLPRKILLHRDDLKIIVIAKKWALGANQHPDS